MRPFRFGSCSTPQDRLMLTRYQIRPDRGGFTVFDIWTGEPVCIALLQQTRLALDDARELAERMNTLVVRGDRFVHQ